MKKLKSLWLTLSGSVSSIIPILFSCCKSGACIGVCSAPVASLFGISTASFASSPLLNAFEPLLIAISAVSFTISYYTLYVLPKFNCNTAGSCDCTPSANDVRKIEISKSIFWIGLTASILFLGYFEYQKYQENILAASEEKSACCPASEEETDDTDSTIYLENTNKK